MKEHDFSALRLLASLGNVFFVLWVLFNWMDEAGFRATTNKALWFSSFLLLLALNTLTLFWKNPLLYLALAGNLLYVLYFLYDLRNWSMLTMPEAISHIVLIGLLALNAFLLLLSRSHSPSQ